MKLFWTLSIFVGAGVLVLLGEWRASLAACCVFLIAQSVKQLVDLRLGELFVDDEIPAAKPMARSKADPNCPRCYGTGYVACGDGIYSGIEQCPACVSGKSADIHIHVPAHP